MTTPFSNGSRFITEFVDHWNKLCEIAPWVPRMEQPEFPEDILDDLATEFEALAQTPMPDPKTPTPIYVSRMHFDEWAVKIRRAMELLESYKPIELEDNQ